MKKFKILAVILAVLLLVSCGRGTKVKNTSDNTVEYSSQKSENKSTEEKTDIHKLQNVDEVVTELKKYSMDLSIEKITGKQISTIIPKNDGSYGNLSEYSTKDLFSGPSTGLYLYNDELCFLTNKTVKTNGEWENLLQLVKVNYDGSKKEIVLAEDVKFMEPFYAYDGDRLYFSYIGNKGGAYLSVIDLSTEEVIKLKEFNLKSNEKQNLFTGEMITLMSIDEDKLIIQISGYEDQNPLSDEPKTNRIIRLNNDLKEELITETKTLDSIHQMEDYCLEQGRLYTGFKTFVNIRNKTTNKIELELKNVELTDASGAIQIDKNFIVVNQLGGDCYIIDLIKKDLNPIKALQAGEKGYPFVNLIGNHTILIQCEEINYKLTKKIPD